MFRKALIVCGLTFIGTFSQAKDLVIEAAKEAISNDFTSVIEKKSLKGGGHSVELKVLDRVCRVEMDNKGLAILTECDDSDSHEKLIELKNLHANLLEDTLIRGYCSFIIKKEETSSGVKNRCAYAEYLTLSRCVETDTCKTYSTWKIERRQDKRK